MAKIIDPDSLVRASAIGQLGVDGNIWIDVATKEITLDPYLLLSTDGVALKAVYSYCKEEWKDDAALIKFKFPFTPITDNQFELVNGWDFSTLDTEATKLLIRDGGWALKDSGGVSEEEYMNVTTLGAFDDSGADLAYFLQDASGSAANITLTGEVNQAIKIYGDGSHGNFDYRGFFQIFLREQGKLYASYDLINEQNISALTYTKYAMPLSNGGDLKVAATDVYISLDEVSADFSVVSKTITDIGGSPFTGLASGDIIVLGSTDSGTNDGTYTIDVWTSATVISVVEAIADESTTASVTIKSIHQSMGITWGANIKDFGSGNRNFGILIDANSGTAEQIYEFVQWSLREDADIDDGAGNENGLLSDEKIGRASCRERV